MIYDFVPEQDLHGYANPWPAGGGANQWDEEWELGSITSEGALTPSTTKIRSKNNIPVSAETKYYIVTPAAMTVHYYEVDDTYISNEDVGSSKEITTPADCAYMLFTMADTYGTVYKHDIAFNYPSTVTTYSPYENICPFFGVDVPGIGTVYQGSVDTDTRELTITHGYFKISKYAATLNYSSTNNLFYCNLADGVTAKNSTINGICYAYKSVLGYSAIPGKAISDINVDFAIAIGSSFQSSSANFVVRDTRFDGDTDDFVAAMGDVAVCYELATPLKITLTENQLAVMLGNLGVARNFNSAEIMVNVWLYMAQGRDPSDLTRQVLRPISKPVIDKPIIDKPISLDDAVKELPADDVISPDEEPEENITEEKEEEDNASE